MSSATSLAVHELYDQVDAVATLTHSRSNLLCQNLPHIYEEMRAAYDNCHSALDSLRTQIRQNTRCPSNPKRSMTELDLLGERISICQDALHAVHKRPRLYPGMTEASTALPSHTNNTLRSQVDQLDAAIKQRNSKYDALPPSRADRAALAKECKLLTSRRDAIHQFLTKFFPDGSPRPQDAPMKQQGPSTSKSTSNASSTQTAKQKSTAERVVLDLVPAAKHQRTTTPKKHVSSNADDDTAWLTQSPTSTPLEGYDIELDYQPATNADTEPAREQAAKAHTDDDDSESESTAAANMALAATRLAHLTAAGNAANETVATQQDPPVDEKVPALSIAPSNVTLNESLSSTASASDTNMRSAPTESTRLDDSTAIHSIQQPIVDTNRNAQVAGTHVHSIINGLTKQPISVADLFGPNLAFGTARLHVFDWVCNQPASSCTPTIIPQALSAPRHVVAPTCSLCDGPHRSHSCQTLFVSRSMDGWPTIDADGITVAHNSDTETDGCTICGSTLHNGTVCPLWHADLILFNELSRYLSNELYDKAYSFDSLQSSDVAHQYRFIPCRDELYHTLHYGDTLFTPDHLRPPDSATSQSDYFSFYGTALLNSPVADRNLRTTYELLLERIAREFQRASDTLCGFCPVVQVIAEMYTTVILIWAALHNGAVIRFGDLPPSLANRFTQLASNPHSDAHILIWIHPNRTTVGWSVVTPADDTIVLDTLHNRFATHGCLLHRPFYPTTVSIRHFFESPTYHHDLGHNRAQYVTFVENATLASLVKQLSFVVSLPTRTARVFGNCHLQTARRADLHQHLQRVGPFDSSTVPHCSLLNLAVDQAL